MPNLSHESSKQFWSDFMDGAIYDIIDFIEQTEDWSASEDEETVEALTKLGTFLDTANSQTELSQDLLLRICSSVYLSQKLRIMQAIDSIQPGAATKLIQHAEQHAQQDKFAKTFLQRNLIFERMRILSRILNPSRIQMVQKVYES